MAHICTFMDRIEVETDWETEQKYLVRTARAYWKDKQLDVYKEYEKGTYYGDERFFARHLMCGMCGYTVYFVGERTVTSGYYYYGNYKCIREEDWQPYGSTRIGGCYPENKTSESDIKAILEVYPEFKYVIKKIHPADLNNPLLMDLINTWKEHKEIEGLCELGLYRIALNSQLFKLTLPKRKAVIKFITQHHEELTKYTTLRDIQAIIKYKTDIKTYEKYKNSLMKCRKRTFDEWHYLVKKGYLQLEIKTQKERIEASSIQNYYDDYLEMCESVGHDLKDAYWHYPSDLHKQHDKVFKELEHVKETASKLKDEYLKLVMKPMTKYNAVVDGYEIFVADDIEIIKRQCDELYQCLIRNGYINKVLMQEEILAFIWKDDKPVATAEIFYDKKLGQFYADERGHTRGESCLPNEEVQKAFMKWYKTFKPIKAKVETKTHYYKGFYSCDSTKTSFKGHGDYHFEIGKTYQTEFDDEAIQKAGGRGCVASNKVFHFCNSVNEISNHYTPTCYCEIQPLGPVLECDGALLSNKIKILRYIPDSEINKLKQLEKGII